MWGFGNPLSPAVIKFAVGLTFFNSFVMFEEFVIDRYGLWSYLPFYRVREFCLWDGVAIAAIALAITWAGRRAVSR